MADKSGSKDEWWRQKRWWIPGLLLVLVGVVGLLTLVIVVPPRLVHMRQPDTSGLSAGDRAKVQAQFETDRTKAENDLRTTLVTTLAGLAVATGTIVAALNFATSRAALAETQRQNRESSELQRRGQVTERFSKAIAQSIRVTIEHGHANDQGNDYSSMAYWYQREPHKVVPELPAVSSRLPRRWPEHGLWDR